MTTIVGVLNRSLFLGSPEVITGPYVRDRDPMPGQAGVAVTTNVFLTVAVAAPQTIVLSTVVIQFQTNAGTPVTVFSGSAFQVGYTGTATHGSTTLEDFYDFEINPDVDFNFNAAITVYVEAEDNLGGTIMPPEFYTFFTAFFVPPPVTFTASLSPSPAQDTIRGGAELTVSASDVLVDTSRDRTFHTLVVSSPWTVTPTGVGAAVTPTTHGLELVTGPGAGSSVVAASSNQYTAFDLAVDVEPQHPQPGGTAPVECGFLEITGGGWVASVSLRIGFGQDRDQLVATGTVSAPVAGPVVRGTTAPALDVETHQRRTLRLVRVGTRLFGFIGVRSEDNTTYTALQQLLDLDVFTSAVVMVTFGVRNLTASTRVSSRFSNFTARSHVLVDGRLVDAKIDHSPTRVLAAVPAAPVESVGLVDVVVFGLAGTATLVNGFRYILPTELSLASDGVAARLFTVQDIALKDGR